MSSTVAEKIDKEQRVYGPPRILLAEDDKEMRKLLSWCLREEGYSVTECADGLQLLDHLGSYLLPEELEWYDLIVSDIRMPGVSGLSILEAASNTDKFPPMILITAFGDEKTHEQAERLGVKAFLDKPFETDDLVRVVREAIPFRVKLGDPRRVERGNNG